MGDDGGKTKGVHLSMFICYKFEIEFSNKSLLQPLVFIHEIVSYHSCLELLGKTLEPGLEDVAMENIAQDSEKDSVSVVTRTTVIRLTHHNFNCILLETCNFLAMLLAYICIS